MKVTFYKVNGENGIAFVPESANELRSMLRTFGGEAYCPDCEQALPDVETKVCPACGEGRGEEPEYVEIRNKSACTVHGGTQWVGGYCSQWPGDGGPCVEQP